MKDPAAPGRSIRFGSFNLDVRSGELRKGPSRLKVPDQSIEILKALLEQPGELVTRERLRQRLWPSDTFVDFEHGLNAAVRRLREALGDSADTPRFIETLPRRGYRFVGTVDGAESDIPVQSSSEYIAAARASNEPMGRTRSRARFGWLIAGILGLTLIAAIGVTWRVGPGETVEPTMFTISAPENTQLDQDPQFAVSPDGRHLVLVASSDGVSKLWLKSRASPVATPMPGTEGAIFPFWSPDSQYLAYFASRRLWKVRIGGRPEEICATDAAGRGGTWNRNNEIVFAGASGPLLKVSAAGGVTVAVTAFDKSRRDTNHRFPHFLPDGRSFLYWAGGGPTSGDIQIGSLDSKESVTSTGIQGTLGLWGPVMFSSGHVLFARDGGLVAQPFDLATRQLKGETVSLAHDVTSFSVSAAGVLAHATPSQAQLTWLDRAGNMLGTVGGPSAHSGGPSAHSRSAHNFMVALSPDERQVATSTRIGSPGNLDIVLFDLARPTDPPRRFTSDTGTDYHPVWSPDGKEVVFTSTRGGRSQIYRKAADFSDREEIFHSADRGAGVPTDWSRDGKYLAYTGAEGIWILPLSGARTPFPFRESPVIDGHAHFSPNVRWTAFTSQESGTGRQVYVAPFPGKGPVQQVSAGGGTQPMWHPNGKELFFLAPDDGLMSVVVETGQTFKHEQARKLFTVQVNQTRGQGNEYAVTKDGSRFLVNVLPSPKHITVVLDWLTLTKR